jgi:hypothetical protein
MNIGNLGEQRKRRSNAKALRWISASAVFCLILTAGDAVRADKACEDDCTQRNNFCVRQLNIKAEQYYKRYGKARPEAEAGPESQICLNDMAKCIGKCRGL